MKKEILEKILNALKDAQCFSNSQAPYEVGNKQVNGWSITCECDGHRIKLESYESFRLLQDNDYCYLEDEEEYTEMLVDGESIRCYCESMSPRYALQILEKDICNV